MVYSLLHYLTLNRPVFRWSNHPEMVENTNDKKRNTQIPSCEILPSFDDIISENRNSLVIWNKWIFVHIFNQPNLKQVEFLLVNLLFTYMLFFLWTYRGLNGRLGIHAWASVVGAKIVEIWASMVIDARASMGEQKWQHLALNDWLSIDASAWAPKQKLLRSPLLSYPREGGTIGIRKEDPFLGGEVGGGTIKKGNLLQTRSLGVSLEERKSTFRRR